MFENIKKLRKIAFLVLAFGISALYICVFKQESHECMGVQILENMSGYTTYQYADFSEEITFFGKPVATDIETNTIYISQNFDKNTRHRDLEGNFYLDNSNYKMYFAPDEAFEDIVNAVKEGHNFRLIITDGSEKYMEYKSSCIGELYRQCGLG